MAVASITTSRKKSEPVAPCSGSDPGNADKTFTGGFRLMKIYGNTSVRPGFRVGSQRVAENGIKSERLDADPKNACYYASE